MDLKETDSHRKWKNRSLTASLEFALTGIRTAFKEERNMKNHIFSAVCAITMGLFLKLSVVEWLFLMFSIFLVIILEILNSAIECIVDLATDYHFSILAKKAKDMAAGAVLMMSLCALLTGMIIFLPKIWHLIFS